MGNSDIVLTAIQDRPGRKAWQIAESLRMTRREVNRTIYYQLCRKVHHDSAFRWWPDSELNSLVVASRKKPDLPRPVAPVGSAKPAAVGSSRALVAIAPSRSAVATTAPRPAAHAPIVPITALATQESPRKRSIATLWAAVAVAAMVGIFAVACNRPSDTYQTENRSAASSSGPSGPNRGADYHAVSARVNYSTSPAYNAGPSRYEGLPPRTYGGVPVAGYYRSNGTYVAPHYRTPADGIKSNNWSYRGNTNPYTGRRGSHR